MRGWCVAISLLCAVPARAQPASNLAPIIVGRAAPDQPWTTGPTEARLSDHAEIAVVLQGRERGHRIVVADEAITPLLIRGRRVRPRELRPWSIVPNAEVRWLQVEPHSFREKDKPAANGATSRFYSNVSTTPRTFGRWLGYDRVTYFETPVTKFGHDRIRAARVHPTERGAPDHGGLGTMRFRVQVRIGDQVVSSPGAEATDRYGIKPTVHRVSIRRDDSILGHLTSYFLVPEIFGSAGSGRNHQTERFIGADCADVLIGAIRRAGFRRVWHTNVASLGRLARTVATAADLERDGTSSIKNVQVGDIIRIDYGGSLRGKTRRRWDHVALLFEDKSSPKDPTPNGTLDPFDLIVHMGHPRLVVEPLSRQLPATMDVLRWDRRKLGPQR